MSAEASRIGDIKEATGDTSLPLEEDIRLGDVLRGERATKGKSLLDVQRELRIRAGYIAAIENCDISAFDAPSFISGYVRSYARYLGLDPEHVFARFCRESGFQPVHGMAMAASGPKPLRRPSDPAEALASANTLYLPARESIWSSVEPRAIGSVAVLLAITAMVGYGGWAALQEIQRVKLTPGRDAPGAVVALDPSQVGNQPAIGEESPSVDLPQPDHIDRVYRPQTLEVPVLAARDGPISAIEPELPLPAQAELAGLEGNTRAAQPAGSVETPRARAMAFGPQLPPDQAAVRITAPDAPEVELLAVRPSWVRVTSADGTVLLEKTLDAGERFALPRLESPPSLRAGNSGAVYFSVNGRTYGPAAPGPQVVKNVELSPSNLTSKYAFADPSQDEDLRSLLALAEAQPAEAQPTE